MTVAIVLLAPPGAWTAPSLTVEVAYGLAAALPPDVPITWWAPSPEDAWLADHDLAAAGLAHRVMVDRRPVPPDSGVTVSTGLDDAEVPRPAIGLGRGGIGPFAVEDLVGAVVRVVATTREDTR